MYVEPFLDENFDVKFFLLFAALEGYQSAGEATVSFEGVALKFFPNW